MKNNDLNPLNPDSLSENLPPELTALAADLDRLAAHEAQSADSSLADRIFVKTRSAVLHEGMTPEVRRVHDDMAAVGVHERAAAPQGLEQRVFDATVDQLSRPAVIGSIGTRQRLGRWAGRLALAAGLAIAAVGGWAVLSKDTPAGNPNPEPIATGSTSKDSPADRVAVVAPATTEPDLVLDKALNKALDEVLASTEAEDSFVALFAFGDDLGKDIRAAASEAERVEKTLSGEQTSGG